MKSILEFGAAKAQGKPISVVTCYDSWSAKILADSTIDAILVGDSAAMVMHGHDSTIPATVEIMALHSAAVSRACPQKFIIADMPFLAHRKGKSFLMASIDALMKAGAHAVKIEGAGDALKTIQYVVESGVPVMGHLGLTPQSHYQLGGFKLQGNTHLAASKIAENALKLQDCGVFAVVLEMVPAPLAEKITRDLEIPTIGIGAGASTSGQVLVLQDLLGFSKNFNPKFLRKYLDGYGLVLNAINRYDADVKSKQFPNLNESY